MNYLAHAYLADNSDEFLIGSFIGDFVKGSVGERFGREVADGIIFHRKIDVFADTHAMTIASKKVFGSPQRRYAGIILDICYDHFLSRHWSDYSDIELPEFIARVYDLLQKHIDILPERLKTAMPHLLKHNWLEGYATLQGVEKTLERISQRIKRDIHLTESMQDIKGNYDLLEKNFGAFFPDLMEFARAWPDRAR